MICLGFFSSSKLATNVFGPTCVNRNNHIFIISPALPIRGHYDIIKKI